MKTYNPKAVEDWFHRAFGVNHKPNRNELQTKCPKCLHPSFFFNTKKQVGFCHHDACHWKPHLSDLIEHAGYAPDEFGGFVGEPDKPKAPVKVELPGTPVIFAQQGQYMTEWPLTVEYLARRNITHEQMLRFNMHCDGSRVYVPIYEGDDLVNYVARDLTGLSAKKYLYCPGVSTTKYLFGWDECQYWPSLTLVENTFVSIWLRKALSCTTNFGSYLSPDQVDKIARSKVQQVVILWDEGAHANAERAVRALREKGVKACFAFFRGQPDDYNAQAIVALWSAASAGADNGRIWVDPFGQRDDILKDRRDKMNRNLNK